MEHIYVFTVNSLAKTFATVDAGHDMRFRFESSNQGLPSDIQEEDLIIGFVGAPTNEFRYCFRVLRVEGNSLVLIKDIERAVGLTLQSVQPQINQYIPAFIDPGSIVAIPYEIGLLILEGLYKGSHIVNQLSFLEVEKPSDAPSYLIPSEHIPFDFENEYRNFITAIKTKPFLLLAGISGTGKSRIVRQLAYAAGGENPDNVQKPYNYEMIQVRPNWHDSTELIGYVTRVSGKPEYVVTDFLRFLAKAWYFVETPFFLCLDEMNLAPVEQYFAEYLSVLETRKLRDGRIVSDPLIPSLEGFGKQDGTNWISESILNDLFGKDWKIDNRSVRKDQDREARLRAQFRSEGIAIPPNLVVMGTVNMDETTFSFSRKVLDRAMTIEMDMVNFDSGLLKENCRIPAVAAEWILPNAVEAIDVYESNKTVCDKVITYLKDINESLKGTPFRVAYRTRNEFMLYVLANLRYEGKDKCYRLIRALDEMTLMKVLSRIEGDKNKLMNESGNVLDTLRAQIKASLINIYQEFNAPDSEKSIYADFEKDSVSIYKLDEMKRKLDNAYYCTFWS